VRLATAGDGDFAGRVARTCDGRSRRRSSLLSDGLAIRFAFRATASRLHGLWLPDGRHVLLTASNQGTCALLRRSLDGSEFRAVSPEGFTLTNVAAGGALCRTDAGSPRLAPITSPGILPLDGVRRARLWARAVRVTVALDRPAPVRLRHRPGAPTARVVQDRSGDGRPHPWKIGRRHPPARVRCTRFSCRRSTAGISTRAGTCCRISTRWMESSKDRCRCSLRACVREGFRGQVVAPDAIPRAVSKGRKNIHDLTPPAKEDLPGRRLLRKPGGRVTRPNYIAIALGTTTGRREGSTGGVIRNVK